MREFKITEEQIKLLVQDFGLGKLDIEFVLKQWFPAAFEPEWEEVSLSECQIATQFGVNYLHPPMGGFPFTITPNKESIVAHRYKIDESGKIWRRKA